MEDCKFVELKVNEIKDLVLIASNHKFNLFYKEHFYINPHKENIFLQFKDSDILLPSVNQVHHWFKKANNFFSVLRKAS